MPRKTLHEQLIEDGIVTEEHVQEALRTAQETGESFDRVLIDKAFVTEETLLEAFSRILDIPLLEDVSGLSVPEEFVDTVPVAFARTHCIVAVQKENGIVRVATASPLEFHPLDDVAAMLRAEVEPVLAPRAAIMSLINEAYEQRADVVDEMLGDLNEDQILGITKEIEQAEDLLDVSNKAPIIKLVNMILFNALKMRASDVHVQPYENKLQVRYRIDGILYDIVSPPKKFQDAIISRIKVMGNMDIAERRIPQDGRDTLRIGDREIDVRISSVPTVFGERIVMRLLDKTGYSYELEELGLAKRDLEILDRLAKANHGIIFLTGPTGSGKTTTLYAILRRIDRTEKNVLTIEDPIEYQIDGVSQIEVSNKKGLTFATGLRSILRQDPDVVMVGEVRDKETAGIAIHAALTGHLVLSTLHTNDAAGAISRLLDLGIEPYLVTSSLIGVGAQRLVRVICPHCRESYEPDDKVLGEIGLKREDLPDGKLSRGRGCDACMGTGYWGRTGIYELLPIDDLVREKILARRSATEIKRDAVRRGIMRTLRMDGAQKVLQGRTTVEEVLRVTQMDIA